MTEPAPGRTLAQRLAAARLAPAHKAIVASLKPHFPDVQVVRHPGRVDVADLVAKDIFSAPALAIAATRARPQREHNGEYGLEVEWTGYVIAEDKVIAGRRVERDEIGHAIGEGLIEILQAETVCRWGLTDITDPAFDGAQALRPVFTVKSYERGVALYAVTWSQTLLNLGAPLWDFTSPPPADFDPTLIMTGEPGYAGDAP